MNIHQMALSTFMILALFVCIHRFLKLSFLNPFSVFFYPTLLYLSISFVGLTRSMSAFSNFTWIVLVSSWIAFAAGIIVIECFFLNSTPALNHPSKIFDNYNWTTHNIIASIFFVFSFTAFVYTYYEIHGTVLFSGRSGELLHGKLELPYPLDIFFPGSILPTTLLMLSSSNLNSDTKSKTISKYLLAFVLILSFCFWCTRAFIMILFIFYLGVRELQGKKLALRKITILPFIGFALFLGIAFLQSNNFHTQILLPYEYIANNFWNLDYALQKYSAGEGHSFTYGLTSLYGIGYALPNGAWASFVNAYGFDSMFNESIQKMAGLNSVSYQWYLFKDFGIFGVIFGTFACAIGIGYLWKSIIHRPKPFHIIAYLPIILFCIQSTFGAPWTNTITLYWFLGCLFTAYISSTNHNNM